VSLTELIQKIHELSPEEQEIVRRELDELPQEEFEATPEMLAAIDEGLRSLREEPTITIEELREKMKSWNFKSP